MGKLVIIYIDIRTYTHTLHMWKWRFSEMKYLPLTMHCEEVTLSDSESSVCNLSILEARSLSYMTYLESPADF